jgi:hypothetical protein
MQNTILSEWPPAATEIGKAFRENLGKERKGGLSIDFFKIEKI